MQYKFIKFGPEGFPLYYYDEATYPPTEKGQKNSDIPADAIAVSDQQWLEASMLKLWRAPDGTLSMPPAAEPGEKIELPAYAAQKRWETEVGGTIWNGWPILTDRESQNKITSEALAIEKGQRLDGDPWKFADGEFRPLTNAQMDSLAAAVRLYIRDSFAIEARVVAEIEAGTISTIEQIDAAFA